jgi:membrane-associated phospholipid phosphatase
MPTIRNLTGLLFLIINYAHTGFAWQPSTELKGYNLSSAYSDKFIPEKLLLFHTDSIGTLHLQNNEVNRGIKPWIAPTLLIAGGTAFHFMPQVKEGVRDFMQDNLSYHGNLDDYSQYVPVAAVYLLNIANIKGKNNFGNRSALAAKSFLLSSFLTSRMKIWVGATRPNLEAHSFPSGHTTTAFTSAHFMHREYGEINPWYSIGGYSLAAATGIMRVAKNAHWFPDVLMGAGVGILSTELVYLTHQYKWDNRHLRRLDILPFGNGNHKGVSLVYCF